MHWWTYTVLNAERCQLKNWYAVSNNNVTLISSFLYEMRNIKYEINKTSQLVFTINILC